MSPCQFVRDESGQFSAIICTGRSRPKKCQVYWSDGRTCGRPADIQCDGPKPGGKTCDRYICREHALHVGKDRDLCPSCAREHQANPPLALDRSKMPKRLKPPEEE